MTRNQIYSQGGCDAAYSGIAGYHLIRQECIRLEPGIRDTGSLRASSSRMSLHGSQQMELGAATVADGWVQSSNGSKLEPAALASNLQQEVPDIA